MRFTREEMEREREIWRFALEVAAKTREAEEEPETPEPIGHCPRCGVAWFSDVGFCGGCKP